MPATDAAQGPRARIVDLATRAARGGVRAVDRAARPLADGAFRGVQLDARPGNGVAWLDGVDFADGTIEVDVRGRDVVQGSFVGVAFHATDDTTYEAVYLRPFNFRAADPERRAHAVQYIALPGYDWDRLRQEHPGVYEQPVAPPPAPDGWTHLRIVLAGPRVRVSVGAGTDPALVIDRLTPRARGGVGLWVGNGSPGDFANLRLTPAR